MESDGPLTMQCISGSVCTGRVSRCKRVLDFRPKATATLRTTYLHEQLAGSHRRQQDTPQPQALQQGLGLSADTVRSSPVSNPFFLVFFGRTTTTTLKVAV